jgi:hypothetical protein
MSQDHPTQDRDGREEKPHGHQSGPTGSEADKPEAEQPEREAVLPAGPHSRPDLIDPEKTPGSGMLPEPGDSNPSPSG